MIDNLFSTYNLNDAMLTNSIREILNLNKIDLTEAEGERLYYSNYKGVINMFLILSLIVSTLFLLFHFTGNYPVQLCLFLAICFFISNIQYPIGRLLLKNPIFILNDGMLYYLEYNKWYDITEYCFSEEFTTKTNYSKSYCMRTKDNYEVFCENNWFFHSNEKFKRKVNSQRLTKMKVIKQKITNSKQV